MFVCVSSRNFIPFRHNDQKSAEIRLVDWIEVSPKLIDIICCVYTYLREKGNLFHINWGKPIPRNNDVEAGVNPWVCLASWINFNGMHIFDTLKVESFETIRRMETISSCLTDVNETLPF